MAQHLIEKGAEVGKKVEYAFYRKDGIREYNIKKAQDLEMFKLLLPATLALDEKFHPNVKRDTLEMAVKFGDLQLIEQVIDKMDNKESAFNQALLFSIEYENPSLMKHFLEREEINLNAEYKGGIVLDAVINLEAKTNVKDITTQLLIKEVKERDLKYLNKDKEVKGSLPYSIM